LRHRDLCKLHLLILYTDGFGSKHYKGLASHAKT
jgi:hypothetical protein